MRSAKPRDKQPRRDGDGNGDSGSVSSPDARDTNASDEDPYASIVEDDGWRRYPANTVHGDEPLVLSVDYAARARKGRRALRDALGAGSVSPASSEESDKVFGTAAEGADAEPLGGGAPVARGDDKPVTHLGIGQYHKHWPRAWPDDPARRTHRRQPPPPPAMPSAPSVHSAEFYGTDELLVSWPSPRGAAGSATERSRRASQPTSAVSTLTTKTAPGALEQPAPSRPPLKATLTDTPDASIAHGSHTMGDLVFSGLLRIDGRFTGTLESSDGRGRLIVGSAGVVEGEVRGLQDVVCQGLITGNVSVLRLLMRGNAARIDGAIEAPGGFYDERPALEQGLRLLKHRMTDPDDLDPHARAHKARGRAISPPQEWDSDDGGSGVGGSANVTAPSSGGRTGRVSEYRRRALRRGSTGNAKPVKPVVPKLQYLEGDLKLLRGRLSGPRTARDDPRGRTFGTADLADDGARPLRLGEDALPAVMTRDLRLLKDKVVGWGADQ